MQISATERLMLIIHTSISYLESRAEEVQKEIDEGLRKAAYAY